MALKGYFKGEYEHTIDAKGRMFIPAKFRDGLGENFVILKWMFNNSLYLMTEEVFAEFAASLSDLPMTNEDADTVRLAIFSQANDAELDAQNRLLISQDFRRHAAIDKEVVVVGVGNHIEIWDRATWREKTMEPDRVRAALSNLRNAGLSVR